MQQAQEQEQQQKFCNSRLVFGIIGCFGGMFIHLVIGCLYQWGIINIYITSYYRLSDSNVTLEGNAIAFPVMMLCIGLTMRLGLIISEKTSPLLVLFVVSLFQAITVFCCSYVPTMGGFIILYSVIFGLVSGLNFMIPMVEGNKYFPGRKMYVNGVVMTGTGMGAVIFGLFSYTFLIPNKVPPRLGYYIGTTELQDIAHKVPECLRWMALIILLIGLSGTAAMAKMCLQNRRKEKLQKQKLKKKQQQSQKRIKFQSKQSENVIASDSMNINSNNSRQYINSYNEPPKRNQLNNAASFTAQVPLVNHPVTFKQAVCSKIFLLSMAISFFGTCGAFMMNGNYKTYAKLTISNDQFLTIIGVVSAIGNGATRIFWSLLFLKTGYRFVFLLDFGVLVLVFAIIRFTLNVEGAYLFLILLNGICLGGFLAMTPTYVQIVFGQKIGSDITGMFWEMFGIANLVQYAFVSGLSPRIGFDGIIYICLGMELIAVCLIIFGNFEGPWKNPTEQLGYCVECCKKQQDK